MDTNTKKIYVVDASFVLAFLLNENENEVKKKFYRYAANEIRFIAPLILKYEVGNSLRSQILRKRLSHNEAREFYQFFLKMKIEECTIDYVETMDISISNNITFYDASYLVSVKHHSAKLLTLDKALLKLVS